MLKKWATKMFGDEIILRERLFRIFLSMGILAMSLAILSNIVMKQAFYYQIPLLAGLAVLILTNWISYKYHRMELAATILVIAIDWIMLPTVYFTSGGIGSGTTIWFVLGLLYIFLLFGGKKLIIMLATAVSAFLLCYIFGYLYPDLVVPMPTTRDVVFDSALSLLIVSSVLGILMKFQTHAYEVEREKVEQHKRELERINESKSVFFANMNHEIRTPINTIIGLNEMTLRENITDEIAENSINIQNASKMLLELVNDILDLSKIESGKMQIIPTEYETANLFRELVSIIGVRAQKKGLKLQLDIDKKIPTMLYGDEVRIRQVLINILTNAVKYTIEGSVTLTANSRQMDADTVELKICVNDTGIGIRKENLKYLFDSFQRVDEENNKNIEGTGLGLSISKQLVDLMGGKIEVDSIYTKGSTFTITIEQKIRDHTPIGEIDYTSKKNLYGYKKYHQSFEAPRARILIVDDNEMNLVVARKLLRDTMVQIDTALSGKDCLEKTQAQSYDVILMDHKMPEMDGVETLHRIRKQEDGKCIETPAIALTANTLSGAEQIYLNYGFEGYLAKPIIGAILEETLLQYIPEEYITYLDGAEEKNLEHPVRIASKRKKKPIYITTECVCDIPKEWVEQFNLKIMYYYVVTKEGEFQDLQEINSNSLLKYMEDEGKSAYSRCASESEYENFFADALENAEEVIHLSIAKQIPQGGYDNAESAAASFDHVHVYDTGQFSSGMGLMVLLAGKMAQKQSSVEEIIAALNQLKRKVSTTFIVPNLNSLYRNNIADKVDKIFCEMFDLHPVLHLSQNKMRCFGFEFGNLENSYKKYIRHQLRFPNSIDTRLVFITYAGCTVKQVNEFTECVKQYVPFEQVVLQQASASISCNCGLGAMGIIFMRK